MSQCQLILGGARSGKSRLAEQLATETDLEVVYIATAQAQDAEMQARILQHQQQRPAHWLLIEEPIQLAQVLQQAARDERCLLVDCLTLWLTNLLLSDEPQLLEQQLTALYECIAELPGQLILVSNETGLGIVPLGELSRRYVDQAGWMHQRLAQLSQRVIFTVAGLPHVLKGAAW
ncbi:adenosylcobinamide kinase [Thiopseudomonas alkaliphila]|uniref:Bifunctional adenosylcobalamin biosynthesis protein n=1 Tax=Thiopseudomonas alkaliphila TaxID=1697053 RepID=A0A0K1XCF9_9GAMM|nr:bifunctional adenosylcobinamide kinase/adenosylcobinamide-phosphate guanylyltransferase [Thiopseudomonas alkaliphila]AKX44531.1 adenosylcobinamide kinase [Thiopseudomonas alkaliphila]AKX46721.1 adenosylcobinamide kinase [Thiopseudomonas alkaliphila]AKX49825.1 adenosylcobinamide kinase [Thiopseudomonas alkaliphila]AKX50548.1 adenosylcobinamide kinase [Thiopseudomonas alkaliphila]AKX52286.1 adenosylcobinamide kinase [Thiopseudomonas alkaliphila]